MNKVNNILKQFGINYDDKVSNKHIFTVFDFIEVFYFDDNHFLVLNKTPKKVISNLKNQTDEKKKIANSVLKKLGNANILSNLDKFLTAKELTLYLYEFKKYMIKENLCKNKEIVDYEEIIKKFEIVNLELIDLINPSIKNEKYLKDYCGVDDIFLYQRNCDKDDYKKRISGLLEEFDDRVNIFGTDKTIKDPISYIDKVQVSVKAENDLSGTFCKITISEIESLSNVEYYRNNFTLNHSLTHYVNERRGIFYIVHSLSNPNQINENNSIEHIRIRHVVDNKEQYNYLFDIDKLTCEYFDGEKIKKHKMSQVEKEWLIEILEKAIEKSELITFNNMLEKILKKELNN